MKTKFKIKPHKLFAFLTLALAILNLFLSNEYVRILIIILGAASLFDLIFELAKKNDKLQKYFYLKYRECDDLVWSYQQMGSYIEQMHIPELSDLNLRIENELRDIKVKQEFTAERLGISDEELEALRNEVEK